MDYIQSLTEGLAEDILNTIHNYDEAVPLAIVIGVLEIVKAGLIREAGENIE